MNVSSTSLNSLSDAVTAAGPRKDSPEKIREAASQFEALLIGEILKASQSEGGGWMGDESDAAGASTADFASEHLARSMASQGGLGLKDMIVKSLARSTSAPTEVR